MPNDALNLLNSADKVVKETIKKNEQEEKEKSVLAKIKAGLEHHLMLNENKENKVNYLKALSLCAQSQHKKEIEYISILADSLGLNEVETKDVISFSKSPDVAEIESFLHTYRGTELAQTFLADAFIIINADDEIEEHEERLFKSFGDKLLLDDELVQQFFDFLSVHFPKNKSKDIGAALWVAFTLKLSSVIEIEEALNKANISIDAARHIVYIIATE